MDLHPFNSLKCLAWADRLAVFHRGGRPAPVTVDVELTNECNLHCPWCFPRTWRRTFPGGMSSADVARLPGLLSRLTVSAVTLTGGGEPLLHPEAGVFLRGLLDCGLRFSVITNGTVLDRVPLLQEADWVGVSVDAGTRETWAKLKGCRPELFDRLCENIAQLSDKVPVTYKVVITEQNVGELQVAVELAEALGCSAFQARPAWGTGVQSSVEAPASTIPVHIVTSKIGTDGVAQKPFRRCLTTPLLLTICADGGCYACQDHRGEEAFRIGDLEDIEAKWGGPEHLALLRQIDPRKCGKCTFSGYNEIFDKLQPEYL